MNFDLSYIIQILPSIIMGLTLHEFSHAYMAYRCWDFTARDLGRVSLNPLKHIDPIGFIFIVLAWFWWAKPVSFNVYNLKDSDSDTIKIASAWPLANAILAIAFSLIFVIIANTISDTTLDRYAYFIDMIYYWIFINWWLFLFNLIPIPPLDGAHIFLTRFKNKPWYAGFYKFWTFALLWILLLESQTSLDILPIWILVRSLSELSLKLFGYSL
ncbi:MAG: peptidase M50 [uncultured bacterium (gcode 4)]|uniref:Peptidase M50 n=1 Tax=uncultured bacterium (gcode 4) TaxID=1234023 RepID=K2G5G4_9BACT|nr:MAG: peptidase M50 [uncultured bacterium (gcode 4)]